MANETIFFLLLLSIFGVAGVLTFGCIRYHLRLRNVCKRLRLTEARLAGYRSRLVAMRGRLAGDRCAPGAAAVQVGSRLVGSEGEAFPPSELRLRLQRGQSNSSGIVERYRLVGNMARRGLSADDISAILQLPQGETEELLKLAQVGRG